MNPLNAVDERWFLRSLGALCVLASLALVVLHQSGRGLRPAERVENPAPLPDRTGK